MPTTHASSGDSAGRNGNDASLPRTKNTCSPTPAPTASAATSVRPTACRSGVTGWRINSLWPTSCKSFMVATTSPSTRAICMFSVLHFDVIDDAHNRGVYRTIFQARRHASGAPADDEHRLAEAGINSVHGNEIAALELSRRIDRTCDEQLVADKPLVLASRDDSAHDLREDHWRSPERKAQIIWFYL